MTQELPPHSPDMEQAILGCILLDPKTAIPRCITELIGGPEAFYDLRHRVVYNAALSLYRENKAIDTITVAEKLEDSGDLQRVGGLNFLSLLPDKIPSAHNIPTYLEYVSQKLLCRKMVQVATEMREKAWNGNGNTPELLAEFQKRVLSISPGGQKRVQTIQELISITRDQIESMLRKDENTVGIPTGFIDLDKLCNGLQRKEVTVVGGYPGSGKTSLALNIAGHAITQGRRVLIISREMSNSMLVQRLITAHASVNRLRIARGELEQDELTRLALAQADLHKRDCLFDDRGDSIYEVQALARELHMKKPLDMIVIDYIQLLTASGGVRKIENRQLEVAEISRCIKMLAVELNVPIVALSQLNEEGKTRESRAIVQDADNVWILSLDRNTPTDNPEPIEPVTLHIAKARSGPRGTVHLLFFKTFTRFESAVRELPIPSRNNPYND